VTHATEVLVGLLAVAALWTVQTTILRAAIGLAATSVIVTLLMFQMGAPLAGVFELSVCAGLITVVFASTISMTRPLDAAGAARCKVRRSRRFHPAFFVVAAVGAALWASGYALEVSAPPVEAAAAIASRDVLWALRRVDLVGQILVLLVGVFGVLVLFKEREEGAAPEARPSPERVGAPARPAAAARDARQKEAA
jgi:NADH-quinone oxidoreductase subunit J